MSKLILVPLESVPSRYTYFWASHLPKMLKQHVTEDLVVIGVDDTPQEATTGAFLNFAYTNIFKAKQAQKIAEMFVNNEVKDGDVFLFTDAWNPTILQVRYMIDLLDIKAKIASIWHAGSYDPQDFLGRKIKAKAWSYNSERAFYEACDMNYFATQFHFEMFASAMLNISYQKHCIAGFPMEYIKDVCYSSKEKTLITFPHRLSEEKNYQLFLQLKDMLPEYEFVACQEQKLSKAEYYEILSRTKILFSANKQETLGIGVFEGMMSGAYPLVPDMLSYAEMYPLRFKYNPVLIDNPARLASLIKCIMGDAEYDLSPSKFEIASVYNNYFKGTEMYHSLKTMLGETA